MVMVPDPATFRVLPWAPQHRLDAVRHPFRRRAAGAARDARSSIAALVERLGDAGYDFVAGLEVEFHVFKLDDPRLRPSDAGQPGQPGDAARGVAC